MSTKHKSPIEDDGLGQLKVNLVYHLTVYWLDIQPCMSHHVKSCHKNIIRGREVKTYNVPFLIFNAFFKG